MNILTIKFIIISLFSIFLLSSVETQAVTGRHPSGVNVNANGVTTVHITFQNLEPNEVAVDAFWCGDVTSTGVVVGTNPCVSGTLLGHLPKQFDLSSKGPIATNGAPGGLIPAKGQTCLFPQDSGLCQPMTKRTAPNNLTDIMTIPTAVIRRAYQEAQRGASSEFFYVRQFLNNGVTTYVTVTCRMSGGGARVPLSLTKVDLNFEIEGYRKVITQVKQGTILPKFQAKISFNGTGLLKGRWEIVKPGDEEPSTFDLLTEASLSAVDRQKQKRYSLLSRFQQFLPPSGSITIPGPDPKLLSTLEKGLYRILLRIEASNDKEGNTDTLGGILNTGGVAGFPMPTLRYFVGETSDYNENKILKPISLVLPVNKQSTKSLNVNFSWFDINSSDVVMYRIEFYQFQGDHNLVQAAYVRPGVSSYRLNKEVLPEQESKLIWKVVALDTQGQELTSSKLRIIELLN